MRWLSLRHLVVPCSVLVGLSAFLFSAAPAFAQSADTATAESLFEQGRYLLRAGNPKEACPKLEESERLDPATGTLLALAMCHEADGKLASAWAEFLDTAARSRTENRPDRQKVAHDRAEALRPRLSTLEIRVASDVAALDGLEIRRDGVLLGHGAWNAAVQIDGSQHVVEVSVKGKRVWRRSVSVKKEGDAALLLVADVEESSPASPDEAPPPTPAPLAKSVPAVRYSEKKRWGTLEWAGVATAGVGVVSLGLGSYFLANALGKESDSNNDCTANKCGPQGFDSRTSAVKNGNAATIFGIAGGALVAGGAAVFVLGRMQEHRGVETSTGSAALTFGVGSAGPSAMFSTQF